MLQAVSAIIAGIAALASTTSALIATRAFANARKTAVRDKYITSLGELVAQLLSMSRLAYQLQTQTDLVRKSRELGLSTFAALDAAVNQLRILEPSLDLGASESGEWLLKAARSLALDVLFADELSTVEHLVHDQITSMRLPDIPDHEWDILRTSLLYVRARSHGHDAPVNAPYVKATFERTARKSALKTPDHEYNYCEVCRMMIDHLVDDFIVPWGAYIVKSRLR